VTAHSHATGDVQDALRQMVVELLLLQSSDWPFILGMKTSAGYAEMRARAHAARIRKLRAMIEAGTIDGAALADLAARDDFLAPLGDTVRQALL